MTVATDFLSSYSKLDNPTSSGLDAGILDALLGVASSVFASPIRKTTEESETISWAEADETAELMTQEDAAWLAMQLAAEEGDAAGYMRAARAIDWDRRNARDFVNAVKWALAAGAHLKARELAGKGAELFPDDHELVKMARILAPPKFVGTSPADPAVKLNREWLRRHGEQYRGKWVAVRKGKLLAAASTLKALLEQVPDRNHTLFTKV